MNESKFYSFLGLIQKAGKLAAGNTNCSYEIKKDKCKLIVIVQDASDNTKDKFKRMCISRGIPCIIYGEMNMVSQSIGKSSISVIGILDENMSKVVHEMVNEG